MSYRPTIKSDASGTLTDLPLDAETVKGEDVVATKQPLLVSGTNIKTINNTSLLGSGDISITGITEIDTQYVRITDLESGLYMLTCATANKKIYYDGTAGTNTFSPSVGKRPMLLWVTKNASNVWLWQFYCQDDWSTDQTLYYGRTTDQSGSYSAISYNKLITTMRYRQIKVNGTSKIGELTNTALDLANTGNVKFYWDSTNNQVYANASISFTNYYRPIKVQSVQKLANTSSTALDFVNDGTVKFWWINNRNAIYATVQLNENDMTNHFYTFRVFISSSSVSFDFDLIFPNSLDNILPDSSDYGYVCSRDDPNKISSEFGVLLFAILNDRFDENDTLIPIRGYTSSGVYKNDANYGILLTGGGTTVYSGTDYDGAETYNYSTLKIVKFRLASSIYDVVATYNLQDLATNAAISFEAYASVNDYPNEHSID